MCGVAIGNGLYGFVAAVARVDMGYERRTAADDAVLENSAAMKAAVEALLACRGTR